MEGVKFLLFTLASRSLLLPSLACLTGLNPSIRNPSISYVSFAASIAVTIAVSGCRFWLPFCTAKSQCCMILPDENELR